MTADEFRAALDGLGLSQVAAAQALEVDARTVRRWALGEREVPGPVRVALRLMRLVPVSEYLRPSGA
jgi:DNA-binding transcriptional regulator YiaG